MMASRVTVFLTTLLSYLMLFSGLHEGLVISGKGFETCLSAKICWSSLSKNLTDTDVGFVHNIPNVLSLPSYNAPGRRPSCQRQHDLSSPNWSLASDFIKIRKTDSHLPVPMVYWTDRRKLEHCQQIPKILSPFLNLFWLI